MQTNLLYSEGLTLESSKRLSVKNMNFEETISIFAEDICTGFHNKLEFYYFSATLLPSYFYFLYKLSYHTSSKSGIPKLQLAVTVCRPNKWCLTHMPTIILQMSMYAVGVNKIWIHFLHCYWFTAAFCNEAFSFLQLKWYWKGRWTHIARQSLETTIISPGHYHKPRPPTPLLTLIWIASGCRSLHLP